MNSERHPLAADEFGAIEIDLCDGALDRKIIRIDIPSAHAGITAALRRAFAEAAAEPSARDFSELLRKLS